MSDWLVLDPKEFNPAQRKNVQGVEVTLYLSPQDVPEAARGGYDDQRQRFVIMFRYSAGEEPLSTVTYNEYIKMRVGKKSRRLHEVEIDVDQIGAQQVWLEIKQQLNNVPHALDWLTKHEGDSSRQGNYSVAKDVITRRREQLLQGAGA